jgi:hypothetical protein
LFRAAFAFLAERLLRLALTTGPEKCRLLRADDRIVLGLFVDLQPRKVFLWDGHIRIDRFHGAFRYACVAVYACVWVDQQAVRQLMKGLDRADRGTVGIFTFDTGFGDYVRHFIYDRDPKICLENGKVKP